MKPFPRLQHIHVLARSIQFHQVHLPDVHSPANVEPLQLRLLRTDRRINVIELLPLNLREKIDFWIEMDRRRRTARADENSRF
jgi:hypothetical protein